MLIKFKMNNNHNPMSINIFKISNQYNNNITISNNLMRFKIINKLINYMIIIQNINTKLIRKYKREFKMK